MSSGVLIIDWDAPAPVPPPGVADILFFRDAEEDSVSFGWVGPENGRVAAAEAFIQDMGSCWEFVRQAFDLVEVGCEPYYQVVWFQRREFAPLAECDFCRVPKAGVVPTYGNRRICPGCAEDR